MTTTELWHASALGETTCAALKKNGFDAHYVATTAQAADYIAAQIKSGASVGFGGSMTVKSLNMTDRITAVGARILDHGVKDLSQEERLDIMRAQQTCDVFVSSVNAITLNGELLNIDGIGNRVAALSFGPKKTIVVVGYNKIVRNIAEAQERLEFQAAPMNNKRLATGNPCTVNGTCTDCKSETRICRVYSIIKRRPSLSDFTVIIVGESLGY